VESLLVAAGTFLTANPERLESMRRHHDDEQHFFDDAPPRLEAIDSALRGDFALRRAMLLKRCDVSVQSFLWGEAAQGNEDEIVSAISSRRDALGPDPPGFTVKDAIAASDHRIAAIAKRLSGPSLLRGLAPKSVAKDVLIGAVPNRGGSSSSSSSQGARFGF
jgi:hypothetical protein